MKKRPVNLNFFTIRFPVTAWVSIAHRLSGVAVFLLIPVLLTMLQRSLTSEESFWTLKSSLHAPMVMGGIWILLAALVYHFIAGVRHLCMDVHIGDSKRGGRVGAWIVIVISLLLFAGIGYYLW